VNHSGKTPSTFDITFQLPLALRSIGRIANGQGQNAKDFTKHYGGMQVKLSEHEG
jgi:hypothetical protein